MKTTVKELDYEKVMALPQYPHLHPIRPGIFWRTLVRGAVHSGTGRNPLPLHQRGNGEGR